MTKGLGNDIGPLCLSMVLLEDEQIAAKHSCAPEGRIEVPVISLLARPPFSNWDSVGVAGARIIDTTLVAECVKLWRSTVSSTTLAGKPPSTSEKALWYCTKRSVEAIVHINAMFCSHGLTAPQDPG
jgi:hypothetical protein